jgi:hypothetical protein
VGSASAPMPQREAQQPCEELHQAQGAAALQERRMTWLSVSGRQCPWVGGWVGECTRQWQQHRTAIAQGGTLPSQALSVSHAQAQAA